MILLWIAVTVALVGMALIAILNALTFTRLKEQTPAQTPFVSILVPARNEAAVIDQTVRQLLAQDYPSFEVLVLDDHSDDGTGQIAQEAGGKVLYGEVLPAGWLGKNWACHQLSEAAHGDILIFTDADVMWQPGALGSLVRQMEQCDVLTVWPTQQTVTWAERLTVSLIALVVIGYLPEILVRRSPWSAFAAANGQLLAFRRAAYNSVDGHSAIKAQIVEDVALARLAKQHRLRLLMADGNTMIGCRMYSGWRSVCNGFAKNILAGYGGVFPLLIASIFHWLVFLAPWIWLAFGGRTTIGYPIWPVLLIILGIGVRALSASVTHQRVWDAIWMPISVILMTIISGQALWWHFRQGGPQWKGRMLGEVR